MTTTHDVVVDRAVPLVGSVRAAAGALPNTTIAPFADEPVFSFPVSTDCDVAAAFRTVQAAQAEVRHGKRVRDEGTFCPVVSIDRCRAEDEAFAFANATPHGPAAPIGSADVRKARHLAQYLRAGGVDIAECLSATLGSIDLPRGGMKDSGRGRRNGSDGLLCFAEAQAIASQHIIDAPGSLGTGQIA